MASRDLRTPLLWTVVAFVSIGVLMAVVLTSAGPTWMGGGWAWMMPLGMAAMVLFVVLVVLLVAAAVEGTRPDTPEDPTRLLERRYAAGEIDRDEYLRIREELAKR